MSTEYFANAVFGVKLDEADEARIREAVERARPVAESSRADWDDLTPADQMHAMVELIDENEGFVTGLRDRYGASDKARLHWTGDEDDRPGRCNIEADVFVLGYGLLALPETPVPPDFIPLAEWFTWVEAAG